MYKRQILQKDYTLSSLYYQIKLPLDLEILIPADAVSYTHLDVYKRQQYTYSQQAIDFIVVELTKDPEHILDNIKTKK